MKSGDPHPHNIKTKLINNVVLKFSNQVILQTCNLRSCKLSPLMVAFFQNRDNYGMIGDCIQKAVVVCA